MLAPGLSLNSTVQRDPEMLAAEADDDLIMVSIANGSYYAVSEVARAIWEAIERPTKVSDLIDGLAATYDVDRSTCERETLSFLGELLTERLLQVRDGQAA
jgi:hypothetical protein